MLSGPPASRSERSGQEESNSATFAAYAATMLRMICFAAALIAAIPAVALTQQQRQYINTQLLKMPLQTRAEQRCDERANGIVSREHKEFRPDRTIAYAYSDPTVREEVEVIAPGAALRSKGEWYHLSYRCRTTPDGLGIEAFDYRLGDKVPRSEWEEHNLFP
jgi:hypothetical protein